MTDLSTASKITEENFDPVEVMSTFFEEARSRAPEFEQERRMAKDLTEKIKASGLFKIAQPEIFGGNQCSPRILYDTIVEASRADASLGWIMMIATTGGMMMSYMNEESVKERLAINPNAIVCGVGASAGKAVPVEGGYRITGKWPFGSGTQNADWIFGGCVIEGREDELPLLASFPAEEVTIHDTWYVSGLCGTGSHHIEVKDAFVEEKHCLRLGGKPRIDAPAYRLGQYAWGGLGVSAVSGGIALHAIESFRELATKKTPTGKTSKLAAQVAAQKDYAKAVALIESSLAYARDVLDQAWKQMNEIEPHTMLSPEMHAKVRLASNDVTWSSAEAVNLVYHLAGGSAIYLTNDLQKCLRDVHVTTQHITNNQAVYEIAGEVLLGGEPNPML